MSVRDWDQTPPISGVEGVEGLLHRLGDEVVLQLLHKNQGRYSLRVVALVVLWRCGLVLLLLGMRQNLGTDFSDLGQRSQDFFVTILIGLLCRLDICVSSSLRVR